MNDDLVLVSTTVADVATAETLADRLVEARLAACVQIVPGIRSVYRWQGANAHADEARLDIKARASAFDAIVTLFAAHHPYDVPEIVATPVVAASAAYRAWALAETAPA